MASAPLACGRPRVRAAGRHGLFFFCLALLAACGRHDPAAVARAADARAGSGVYTWLAEHDPSALVLVRIDPRTTETVAPDARLAVAPDVASGCRRARRGHALLAARVAVRSAERERAEDCGFALFRDDAAIVVAPR